MLITLFALALQSAAPASAPDPRASFFAAAREGRADLVAALLDAGAPVDARDDRGYTALTLAAYNGKTDLVALLIARGADACAMDPRGNTALMGAAFKGDDAMARLLLDKAPCPVDQGNAQGQTALMMASLFGREAQVRMLVAKGAATGLKDASGNTALSLAERQGATGVMAALGGR
ncbi:ankyrin repeat domain-containing protein [Caulobacter sp. 602-2]|uniref:Ankyrin repeat domain-containing protein n=1 Tax=Caulobacter sp. 602-2 TaxID=2710887 RepID=A0A6G4QZE9_9CAUL|nr:ankyrin repeat domain-containing protein [Caulobacter sp. 602-2]NGM50829.1 ankyrin repeat domain-containing protein [Caulobacter sp. 602-2]